MSQWASIVTIEPVSVQTADPVLDILYRLGGCVDFARSIVAPDVLRVWIEQPDQANGGEAEVVITRDQARQLRDALTGWLAD